jgi:hypothetical protein
MEHVRMHGPGVHVAFLHSPLPHQRLAHRLLGLYRTERIVSYFYHLQRPPNLPSTCLHIR